MNFKDLELSEQMLETLELIGYKTPSPIQEKAIVAAKTGNDIIGQAQTGTGKTAAFGIPIIENTMPKGGLQHIILAPSRELATQIYNEIHKLAMNKGIKVIDIIGGISYTIQQRSLATNPEIIVATPGRFIDNLDKNLINMAHVKTFTLDEADEMLNFGFYKEIKNIRNRITQEVQTFFFTATFNKKIKQLANEILKNPVTIEISGGLSTSSKIEQKHVVMKEKQKLRTLINLLQMLNPKAAIIFGRTRRRVDELTSALKDLGFSAVGIQGDMRQRERSNAMQNFREGRVNILVGTDVMARGIDVDNVDYVFNFDLPTEIEYYTHRIGRTGRASKKGVSISFVKPSEMHYFGQIMKSTDSTSEEWPIPSDKDMEDIKAKEMENALGLYLKKGQMQFAKLGEKLAKEYSPEQLGIIISEMFIGSKQSAFDIVLTGEQGMDRKQGGRSRGGRRGGGGSRDRRSSGGSRDRRGNSGSRDRRGGGNDRRSSGGSRDRRGNSGSRDRRSGGNDRRSSGGSRDRRSSGGESRGRK